MSLADYLAKNYLTADSEKKSKKRKRKNKDGGLTVDDDDILGWKKTADDNDEDAPMIGMGRTESSPWLHANRLLQLVEALQRRRRRSRGQRAPQCGQLLAWPHLHTRNNSLLTKPLQTPSSRQRTQTANKLPKMKTRRPQWRTQKAY
jgi:hypothetical protein